MPFLNSCTFFDCPGIGKAGDADKQRGCKFIDEKLKGKRELALAHLESNFWGLKQGCGFLTFIEILG